MAVAAEAQRLLVPMDDSQQNHLKAYGLTYNAIKAGASAEWLLNYRGGAFLIAPIANPEQVIFLRVFVRLKVSGVRCLVKGPCM